MVWLEGSALLREDGTSTVQVSRRALLDNVRVCRLRGRHRGRLSLLKFEIQLVYVCTYVRTAAASPAAFYYSMKHNLAYDDQWFRRS